MAHESNATFIDRIACFITTKDFSEILAQPLKRSLADEVTASIRDAILNGHLLPGARLQEERLASTLKVSRGPVREAILQLEREGLVIVYRNRGTFVARLSLEDLEEVYSLRRAIEPLAVQRAMQYAEPRHLQELQNLVDKMAEFGTRGITEQEAAELDLRFHDVIYQASKHRRLYDCWTTMQAQIHILLLTRNVVDSDFRDYAVKSHQEILDAIRNKQEVLALELIADHLKGSYERVSRSYARHVATQEKLIA